MQFFLINHLLPHSAQIYEGLTDNRTVDYRTCNLGKISDYRISEQNYRISDHNQNIGYPALIFTTMASYSQGIK